jgi:hypothetical protein
MCSTPQELGAAPSSVKDGVPSPTFNDGHPDPNLTYAKELVRCAAVSTVWGLCSTAVHPLMATGALP